MTHGKNGISDITDQDARSTGGETEAWEVKCFPQDHTAKLVIGTQISWLLIQCLCTLHK